MKSLPQPIKDLGKTTLTEVANKFVDFIIKKYTGKSIKVFNAEADIEADKVKTKWEVLEKPFWLQAEAAKMNRQYSNMGNVLLKSAPIITASKSEISDDNDVFWGFLEHSKEISNEKMQELIAKIIAGEYNTPGTYAMNTLQIIKMLGKNELELFEKMCSLIINDGMIPNELFSLNSNVKKLMNKIDIDFGSLQTLLSLSLFLPNAMARDIENPKRENFHIQYFNKQILFTSESETFTTIKLPVFFGLSIGGKQILQHLKPKYIEDYFVWLESNYKIPNYKLSKVKD